MKKLIFGGFFLASIGIVLMGCKKVTPQAKSEVNTNPSIENNQNQRLQVNTALSGAQLLIIHNEIIINPAYKNQDDYDQFPEDEIFQVADNNLQFVEDLGSQNYLTSNGYREDFLEMVHYWYSLEGSLTRYQDFANLYQIDENEANLFFQTIEMNNSFSQQAGLAAVGPCADAVISTVLTTVGAIGVGGPVGLGIWLVSKGWSTYQLIKNCK
jgi:hypothetical protein